MSLHTLILNNLSESEIESLLHEKKKMSVKPIMNDRETEIENYLKSKVLKYKNPLICSINNKKT